MEHLSNGPVLVPTTCPILDLVGRLGKEATGERGIRIDRHTKFAQGREELKFEPTSDGTVTTLIDGGQNAVFGLGAVVILVRLILEDYEHELKQPLLK